MNPLYLTYFYLVLIVGLIIGLGFSISFYVDEKNKKDEDQDKNKLNWSLAGIIITSLLLVSLTSLFIFAFIRTNKNPIDREGWWIPKIRDNYLQGEKLLGGYDTTDNTPFKNDSDNEKTPLLTRSRSTDKNFLKFPNLEEEDV